MKNITIVGVGALGSHTALLLRNEGALKLIDHDHVEQKNLLSQFHGKPNVGKPKVQALGQVLQFLFGVKAETVPHKLTTDNVQMLLHKADLVIDALDNGASRRVVQQFVRQAQIPCLHGALGADGGLGRVVWDQNFVVDDEPTTGAVATCEGGEHLPFITVVSAWIAYAAQQFLRTGKQINVNVFPSGAKQF